MKNTALMFFVFLAIASSAQESIDYSRIDDIMENIPPSSTNTTDGIAAYINDHFESESDKSRAAFIWVAGNIEYDVANMFAINYHQDVSKTVEGVLNTRKGICMHFSELFNEIATKSGLNIYVISGYTKQNGFVDYIPHAWCAGLIDSEWYFFDPTWGSGYLDKDKFVREINNFYYLTSPADLIKSHMPFDPLWQFLYYPVTNQEFYEGNTDINKNKAYFDFPDTLSQYENESEIDKLVSANRRIRGNGVKSSLIFNRLQDNQREIEYHTNKSLVENYNTAVNSYNEGINQLNDFINYRNKQFQPKRTDDQIKLMLDDAEFSLISARNGLNKLKNPDPNTATSISQMNKAVDDAFRNLKEQQEFVEKYINTSKAFRSKLFYK